MSKFDKPITVKLSTEDNTWLREQAEAENKDISQVVRSIIAAYREKRTEQYGNIPEELLIRVRYMMVIALNGKPNENNFGLLKEEVIGLWKIMQSSK